MPARSTTDRREAFERLVRDAEATSASSSATYTRRVVLLACLGYAVLALVVLSVVGLLVGLGWAALSGARWMAILFTKKLGFGLVVLLWAVLKALWVRIEAPTGYVLDATRFPMLHGVINDVRARLASAPMHQVILTEDFNAAVAQTPRLGVFGWQKNTLILGLPLLMALSPDQARAVLAHEFGHLSSNHSRLGGWIYRVRTTWYRVMHAFDDAPSMLTWPIRKFFDWYAPYFAAYSFVLARANEYEADRVSAQVTSPKIAASALVAADVRHGIVDDGYWTPLFARADMTASAETTPFTGLARFLAEPTSPEDVERRLRDAQRRTTDYADTHPALADRLKSLGVSLEAASTQRGVTSAAQSWLGREYAAVVRDFDGQWHARNEEPWANTFQEAERSRTHLATLETTPVESLSSEQQWNLAYYTERFRPEQDALPLYRGYAERHPDDPNGHFAVGRLLCARDDDAGIPHLERAAAAIGLVAPACDIAFAFYTKRQETDQARQWRLRAEQHADLMALAYEERAALRSNDQFEACDLTDAELAPLVEHLRGFSVVKAAWIAKKVLKHAPDDPVYVVTFQARGLVLDEAKKTAAIVEALSFPHTVFVLMKGGSGRGVAKRVMAAGRQIL